MGPLPEANRCNKHILVLPNGIHEALAAPNQKASTVTKILVDGVLNRFRPPVVLHSDQGANFESTLMKRGLQLMGITKSRTTSHQPQCDEKVERQHRTCRKCQRHFVTNMTAIGIMDRCSSFRIQD